MRAEHQNETRAPRAQRPLGFGFARALGGAIDPASARSGALRRSLLAAALLSVVAGAAGCASVAPYERETLARRDMAMAGNSALRAGEEHAQAYREGSSGGGDAKGGGCGCN